ncbi:MAG: carboxypeptidase regulatory-like domain-containing protein [Blastocatellia bacterium]|nr:carboxypeptidase regulatory-like domain-containing protein [Blastocatellia bacterium]
MKPWIFKYQIRIAALVLLALLTSMANAQEAPGSLLGTARDSTGAAVAGAKVTITDTGKKAVVRVVTANGGGEFSAKENFIP